ncbi:cadmium-translocating P-type ATPase [Fructobacillus sp. M1-13]|uniref:P-type Cu(+) transporter n=2 Tax=Fructobacillus papyriferae TaxID=2713171 RepID=A0ABS5QT03_9LACO|nr:copper-translocating P-type ATPase [Fructobacillus papyriferae]MBS9335444.1 cadmium-translocating P-type ATPase [Fructobacillus papyriferae]MCD2159214.1 cadmium-translocating P-type ATPase [Fructobacillus papyriferae]
MNMGHDQHDMSHMDHMNMGHDQHDMSHMDHMNMGHDMPGMGGMHMMMNHGDMKKRFWWSFGLLIPILFITPFMGIDLPFTLHFPFANWLTVILASAMYAIGTKPFFDGAKSELKAKKPAMMSLISMGLLVTFWVSIYSFIANTFLNGHAMDYFFEFASLVVIMLLGHLIEMQATMKAGNATSELAKLTPETAHVKHGDSFTDQPVSSLKPDMTVQVRAGESFPADGIVLEGSSQVDESLMTGESKPVKKAANAKVIGGTINDNGTLIVKVQAVGADSFIGHLKDTLNQTEQSSSKAESLANKVAGWLFWVGLSAAVFALIVWTFISGPAEAFNTAVTTLIIACPHALGLAIPLVIQRTKAIAAKDGILIKKHGAVLQAKHLDYALMDKTGTLTTGHFAVQELQTEQLEKNAALAFMAALESQSSHPLAKAIVEKAKELKLPEKKAENVQTIKGAGIEGDIDHRHYQLVNSRYLEEHAIDFNALATDGSVSYLVEEKSVLAAISLGDSLKPSAKDFVNALLHRGITPVMVTGDAPETAQKVADELGIQEVKAQVSPEDKIKLVKDYQKKGQTMMIGDGINDAPALAQADLSVAIGAGTDVAQASADAVLISTSLPKIIDLIQLAHNANEKEVQNLWWGAGYNILAIPTAAGVFAFAGIVLNPLIGAIVMSCSTLIVAGNAMLLHK